MVEDYHRMSRFLIFFSAKNELRQEGIANTIGGMPGPFRNEPCFNEFPVKR